MVLANATLITVVDVGYVIPTEPLFCLLSDTELCLYAIRVWTLAKDYQR